MFSSLFPTPGESYRVATPPPPAMYSIQEKTTPSVSDGILTLLEQQYENFPALHKLMQTRALTPSVVFLPQSLKALDTDLSQNQDLVLDCLTYLDMVRIYSLVVYGDCESFLASVVRVIVSGRTAANHQLIIAKDALDDFLFTSEDETVQFLQNNQLIVAIYLFSLVKLMFFKNQG